MSSYFSTTQASDSRGYKNDICIFFNLSSPQNARFLLVIWQLFRAGSKNFGTEIIPIKCMPHICSTGKKKFRNAGNFFFKKRYVTLFLL
jgi:hypothetical protein